MSRKEARETVFKLVYERCILNEKNAFSFSIYSEPFDDDDKSYIKMIYDGVDQNNQFLNGLIQKYSTDFKLDRVYKVDLAALLIAAFEILYLNDIPFKISVNEAVELSKKYSTEKSYKFVNGILSSIIKDIDLLKQQIASC